MMAEEPRIPEQVPYGEFVDWDKRLHREGPFFRQLFEANRVSRVIDLGAGSARHAIMFATWGIDVVAVDPSESMLEEARENLERFSASIEAGGGSVELLEGGFGDLGRLGVRDADALVCTGNALPHVEDIAALRETFEDMAAAVRPGAIVVLHLLNHDRLLESRVRAIVPKVRDTAAGMRVFLRLIDYGVDASSLDFDFVTLTRAPDGEWAMSSRRSRHTVLTVATLSSELRAAGFGHIELFGDHNGRSLDVRADESVIVVARRD